MGYFEDTVKDRYFKWLCSLVRINAWRGHTYYILAEILHRRSFYGFVGNDDDRGADGKHLRFLFASTTAPRGKMRETIDRLEGPVSCLEMLAALSMRIANWLDGNDDASGYWFHTMIGNLGLEQYHDLGFVKADDARSDISRILDCWLDRRYGRDGRGGLFPLRNPNGDQTKKEIWFQMNQYLSENYDLDS